MGKKTLKMLLGVCVVVFCLGIWSGKANALFEPPERSEIGGKILFKHRKDSKIFLYTGGIRIYVYSYKTVELAKKDFAVTSPSQRFSYISSKESPILFRHNAFWLLNGPEDLFYWFRFGSSIVGVEFPKRVGKHIAICEKLIRDEEKRQKDMFATPLLTLSTFQSAVKEKNWDKARSCLSSNLPEQVEAYWDYMTGLFLRVRGFQAIEKGKEVQPSIDEPIIKGNAAQVKVDFSEIPQRERYQSGIMLLLGRGMFSGKMTDSGTINFVKEDGLWKIYLSTSPFQERVQKAKEQAKKAACMSNLKQIGLALHMYATDHNEKFPKTLKELYPKYLSAAKIFRCPADKNIKEIKKITKGAILSYTYVKGLTKAESSDTVLVYDASVENHGDGRNVLFLDGHVKWYQEKEFQKLLRKTEKNG